VRSVEGRFLLPPDLDERLDEREAALLRRLERLRGLAEQAAAEQARLTELARGVDGRLAAAAAVENGRPDAALAGRIGASGAPIESAVDGTDREEADV
jgi:hypothetical protein